MVLWCKDKTFFQVIEYLYKKWKNKYIMLRLIDMV